MMNEDFNDYEEVKESSAHKNKNEMFNDYYEPI